MNARIICETQPLETGGFMTTFLKLNIRIILFVFVMDLMFLSIYANYSYSDNGNIMLTYPKKAGDYMVSGSIREDEWKKSKDRDAYEAKLWTLLVIHNVDGKIKSSYTMKGFSFNRNAGYYVVDLKKEEANKSHPAAIVYVFGFRQKPNHMTFNQNISVVSDLINQNVTKDNFKITGKSPNKLEFGRQGEKNPIIKLYFNESKPDEEHANKSELEPDEHSKKAGYTESNIDLQSSETSVSKPIEFIQIKRSDSIPVVEWCNSNYLVNSSSDYYDRVNAAEESTTAGRPNIIVELNSARQRYLNELITFGRYLRKMKLLRQEKDQLNQLKAVCEEQIQNLEYSFSSYNNLSNELQSDQNDIILPSYSKHMTAYLQKDLSYFKNGEVFDIILSAMKIEMRSQIKKIIGNELGKEKKLNMETANENLGFDNIDLNVCVLTKDEAIIDDCKDADVPASKRYYVTAILKAGPNFSDSKEVVSASLKEDSKVVFIESLEELKALPCEFDNEKSGYERAMNRFVKRFEDMAKIIADEKHKESINLFKSHIKMLRHQQGAVLIRSFAIKKVISQLEKNIDEIDQRLSLLQKKIDSDEISKTRIRINETEKEFINTLSGTTFSVIVPEVRGKNYDEITTTMMEEGRIAVDVLFREILGGLSKKQSNYWLEALNFKPSLVQPLACREVTDKLKVAGRIDFEAGSHLKSVPVSKDEKLLLKLNLIDQTVDPEGVVTVSDFIEGHHVRHYGFGLTGYTLEDANEIIKTDNQNWRLPSVEDLKKLSDTVIWRILSNRTKIEYDVAYWTNQRAPSGDSYGFCFGGEGDCSGKRNDTVESPKSDALSLILLKNDE
jgi:hypothetical protein